MNSYNLCRSISRGLLLAGIVVGLSSRAFADTVTLGNVGTINMTPGDQTPLYTTISLFDAGGPTVQMSGWQISLRIVPLGGATGTVTLDVPSRAYPSGNIIGDPFPSGMPYAVANSPTAGDTVLGANSNSFSSYTVTGGGQNLINLKFNASGLASGNFDLRVVEVNENTYWTDGTFVNRPFFVNGVPLALQTPGSMSLGTISVVPEPSSGLLVLGALAGLVACRNYRKR